MIVISKWTVGLGKHPKTALFCLLFISTALLGMQQNPPPEREGTLIVVEHADNLIIEKDINPDMYKLDGNVIFRHEGTYMYCDSAYLYNNTNSLEAFSNVIIEQGDSLFMYGDYLHYEGNISLAKMLDNVRMENRDLTLYTDHFNYDRIADKAYYFDGGMLVDSVNELTSVYGQYDVQSRIATFQNIVELVNPQFLLESDTLIYDTVSKIASIVSPTKITGDSGVIYSHHGYYNTVEEIAELYNRSTVVSKDQSKTITADTLLYNRITGFSEAFSNMIMNDTARKAIITGNYGFMDERENFAFATDSAQFIEYSQQDSLFLHADTLQMRTVGDEREISAWYGVRFYRIDMQGVADSMQYNTVDTLLSLYKNPILWNENYQVVGDTIRILFNEETIERVNFINYAFAIEHVDSLYFNQLKGRNMTAYFLEGEMHKLDIDGNAESIYYPIEEGGGYIGQNTTQSSFITIDIRERKPVRIVWSPTPKGVLIPIPDISPENKYLKDFVNYDYIRPKTPQDIFIPTVRRQEDIPPQRRRRGE